MSTPETPAEALRVLEKWHDKVHPQSDGWWCSLQPGCEIQAALAVVRAALEEGV